MEVTIPCSDDLCHPDGTTYSTRILPNMFLERVGQVSDGFYPLSSPHRCFNCFSYFDSVPLFYPRSVVYQTGNKILVEWAGHYCSAECRTQAVDDMRDPEKETHFMNIVRMDRVLFPRNAFDYTRGAGADKTKVNTSAISDEGRARLRTCFEVRGVREIFYGKNEGGIGKQAIYETMRLAYHSDSPSPPSTAPAPPSPLPTTDGLLNVVSEDGWDTDGKRCWWCMGSDVMSTAKIPTRRDMLNTVHVRGSFCDWACALTYMMHDPRKSFMLSRHENIGLLIYMAVNIFGSKQAFRPCLAPHRFELVEFGGDLTRQEFEIQKQIPDLVTLYECSPFVSSRMSMNYARPVVVCDLSRLGESTFEPQKIEMRESEVYIPTLFEELTNEA